LLESVHVSGLSPYSWRFFVMYYST